MRGAFHVLRHTEARAGEVRSSMVFFASAQLLPVLLAELSENAGDQRRGRPRGIANGNGAIDGGLARLRPRTVSEG